MKFSNTKERFEIDDEVIDNKGVKWIIVSFHQSRHSAEDMIDWIICKREIDGTPVMKDFGPEELKVVSRLVPSK